MPKVKQLKLYIIDNSVILKTIIQEEGSELARKLIVLKNKYEISILVPDIFRYEFFNKLIKGMDGEKAMEIFQELIERQVSILPLENDLIEMANKLVIKYPKISFYDAAYHALAKAYDAELITADEKYYALTQKEGNIRLLRDLKV